MDKLQQRIENRDAVKGYQDFHRFLAQRESLLRLYIGRLTLCLSLSTHRRRKGILLLGWRRVVRNQRLLQEKLCLQCGEAKQRKDFFRDVNRADGHSNLCKICTDKNMQDWLEQPGNRARTLAHAAAQRERNAGNETVRAYHREKSAEWNRNHPEERRAQVNAWSKEHPEANRRRNDRRRAHKANAPVIEDVTLDEIYLRDKGLCNICHKKVLCKQATRDHIIPLSKGGEHSRRNIVLTHRSCNSQKKNGSVPQQQRLF